MYELEGMYLSSLMNGGDIQGIKLSEGYEPIHAEIRRLREMGAVKIPPGAVLGTDAIYNSDMSPALAGYVADKIREVQKRAALKKLMKEAHYGNPDAAMDKIRSELDRIADENGKTDIIDAPAMKAAAYENTEFFIQGILPVGLTVLLGAPKMGKSWLALLMAECITSHFPLFGYTSKRNHVLYYSLEDGIRQCKYRLNKIGSQWSPLLHFCDAVRDISGIMSGIRETDARIVFIDTFIAFSDIEDNNSYSETTRKVRELKRIADTLNIAIVVVHHKKKGSIGNKDWMESSMGSQGLVGAADCVISLERERGKDEAVLLMSGRSVSDRHIEIQWEDCTWVKRVK